MRDITPDRRRYAPATDRNREPILDILRQVLPPAGTVLEISSGTGEHAVFFAPNLAPRHWLPSDPNPEARASIAAWQQAKPYDFLYPPIDLDARQNPWSIESDLPVEPIVAIVNINMIHISPLSACRGLLAGANRILPKGGILYLYGPFIQEGVPTAPSNLAFDASLRSQHPEWGIRQLEEIIAIAQRENLVLKQIFPMPANNLSVIFEKQ